MSTDEEEAWRYKAYLTAFADGWGFLEVEFHTEAECIVQDRKEKTKRDAWRAHTKAVRELAKKAAKR